MRLAEWLKGDSWQGGIGTDLGLSVRFSKSDARHSGRQNETLSLILEGVDLAAACGWYEHGQDPVSVTNVVTGQRLTVVSRVETGGVVKLQVRYQDADLDLTLPLVLRQGEGTAAAELDYRWAFAKPPAPGLWRRLDDFLTDALVAWSPDQVFDTRYQHLTALGAWQSGVWQPSWQRRFSLSRSSPPAVSAAALPSPWMASLTEAVSWPWRYIDVEHPVSEVSWRWVDGVPQGIQSQVPCLEREGPPAWLFPSRLEPELNRGEDPMGLIDYTLAQAGHAFTFRHHPIADLNLLYVRQDDNGKHGTPSYQDWKAITSTLVDAWPCWRAPPRIMPAPADSRWRHPFGFSAPVGEAGLRIQGGYVAGLMQHAFQLSLAQKG